MSNSGNYLGFVNLPNQVHRKSVKKGFEFTLMIVGESGLGKSTLVNALFLTQLYGNKKHPDVSNVESNICIEQQQVDVEEKGVRLKLTIVDCRGFGDSINDAGSIEPIEEFIDCQFEKYFDYESGLNRRNMQDTRVHCCFYFISPLNHGLKPLDVEFMKRLHTKVNIVPLIAKADSLTRNELESLKKAILADIERHNINVYSVPDTDPDEEPAFQRQIEQIKAAMPFAICASVERLDGNPVRQYTFGTVETENENHCDFVKLRSMLVSHMQDMREVTAELLYENYRSMKLANGSHLTSQLSLASAGPSTGQLPSFTSASDQDKDRLLMEKEQELARMQKMLQEMQQKMQSA